MPALSNPKHERFARELAQGKSQIEAYELAGYKPNYEHASRLARNGKVQARLAEFQERSAKRAEITIDSLREMLLEDRDLARDLGQSSAAVSAVAQLGKLYGLVVERKEVGRPGEFENMNADQLRDYLTREAAALGFSPPSIGKPNGSGKPH